MKLADPIFSPPVGSIKKILAWAEKKGAKRLDDLEVYLTELQRLSKVTGMNFAVLVAQSAHETDNWTSEIWEDYLNPAGIGATGVLGESMNYVGLTYKNGKDAARAHVVHMWAYVKGAIGPTNELYKYIALDPRYNAVFQADYDGMVTTLNDFQVNGRWADVGKTGPPWYGQRIVDKGKEMGAALTAPLDDPTPAPVVEKDPFDIIRDIFVDAYATKRANGQGYDRGKRYIMGLAEHETQGKGIGSFFRRFFSCLTDTSCKLFDICTDGERCGNALVDYVIPEDGTIWQLQDPFTTDRIPYASGGTPNRNTIIGKAINNYIAKRGLFGGVNALYAAVEIVKLRGAAMNAKQIEATARLLAYICVMCGYPANDWKYPDILGGDVPTSINHSDAASSTNCRINDDDRAKFEKRCTEIMEDFYEGTTPIPTQPTDPVPVPADPDSVVIVEGVDWGIAKWCFGTKVVGYTLTQGGPLSELYVARAKTEGVWPELVERKTYADGRVYFRFSNGWLALDPPGESAKVKWVTKVA